MTWSEKQANKQTKNKQTNKQINEKLVPSKERPHQNECTDEFIWLVTD